MVNSSIVERRKRHMKAAIATVLILAATSLIAGDPDPATCPLHEQHMKEAAAAAAAQSSNPSVVPMGDASHGADVDGHHDTLVPSHETTRHSFRLFADGGAIELRASDRADNATIDGIRAHLHEIVAQFVKNDFSTPAFVHGRQPAGIAAMLRLHDTITFRYESVESGGRIRIRTANHEALEAIHDFLKFQVVEHRTENTGKVEPDE
jgi:hypothetical protein